MKSENEVFGGVPLTRRKVLTAGSAAVGGVVVGLESSVVSTAATGQNEFKNVGRGHRFTLGLNTSTIRGQKLGIVQEIDLATKAGFEAMEPWLDELRRYEEAGGSLADLGKRFRDAGIKVVSAIDFFEWIVDDEGRRRKAMEAARRSMGLLRKLGGERIAAPPAGATDRSLDLHQVAERYRELLRIGDAEGVVPQVEVWGPSRTLGRLSEAVHVAMEADHPSACVLPDVYHLYRGGSSFRSINLLGHRALHVFHFNDYPAMPSREKLTDADRVYPGDGSAPIIALLRDLNAGGFDVTLSLEVFNRDYWKQDPAQVLATGFAKMRALVKSSMA